MKRFGVSLEDKILVEFDKYISKKGLSNRSQAIADLIKSELVKDKWHTNDNVAGAILCVYDHHKRDIVDKLTSLQHDFMEIIISTQHIHLDHDNCLEIIAIKGRPKEAQKLEDVLKSVKGVKHTTISITVPGKTK